MNSFGVKSKRELQGVHAHLVIVTTTALVMLPNGTDFCVFDGLRTKAEQLENINRGVSWTMKSRHLTGHAVDLVPIVNGQLRWDSPDPEEQLLITASFSSIAMAMAEAAELHNVPIESGFALWGKDKPHFQLPKGYY
jgi:peptidoglycan L-alanyl-D-glutamate endopeptidase CwlK